MTIIEGAEIDQALIGELRQHGERLAALMPEIREVFGALIPALTKIETIHWEIGPLEDDEAERFGAATGSGPIVDMMFELNDMSDFDSVHRAVLLAS